MADKSRKDKKNKKIRNQLIFVLMLAAVIPLLIFGYLSIEANRDDLRDYERVQQTNLAVRMRVEIEDYMKRNFSSLKALSYNFAARAESSQSGSLTEAQKRKMLRDFFHSTPNVLYVRLYDTKGISVEEKGFKLAKEQAIIRKISEGRAKIKKDESYLSPVLTSSSLNQPVVLYLLPVKLGKRTIAEIHSLIGFMSIHRILRERAGENYEIFMIDGSRTFISKANLNYIANSEDLAKIPIVSEFFPKDKKASLPNFSINRVYDVKTDNGSEEYLGTFTPIKELGWGLFVQLKSSIAFKPVQQMINRALLMLLIAVTVSIIVGLYFATSITKPLRSLTEATNTMAEGKFDQDISIQSRNEIGVLANRFNAMSAELQKLILSLQEAARSNRELFINSLRMISAAVDEKDPYTRGHTEKVREYSVEIATIMGLSQEEIERIAVAAILHDVGKIGIDDSVLRKPGTLTPEEYEIMKQHPQKGAYIISPIKELQDVVPGILYHHEKYDGTGYPKGLKGDAIPLQARIIAVADTFDAMTSDRPYQKSMEVDYVFKLLFDWAGKRFDETVIASLFQAYEQGRIKLSKSRSSVL